MLTRLRALWAALSRWVSLRVSTPTGRLGTVTCVIAAITWLSDQYGDPPVYLTGLLAASVGAFLAALGAKSQEQTKVTEATANRAEVKADEANASVEALGRIAAEEHPDRVGELTPPLPPDEAGEGPK